MTPRLVDTPVLETERLILRAPQMSDFDAFEAFLATDRAEFVGGPYTHHQSWRAFGHFVGIWALRGCGMFVMEDTETGAPLGSAGPWHPVNWPDTEIGWSIWSANAEGKGIAFEAASAARDYAYKTLGWTTAVSYIDNGNDRSVALAERMGARLDPDAATPDVDDPDLVIHVYRHPSPEALQ